MTEHTERWLPVAGWETLYEVSDLGKVRSLPRQTRRGIRGGNLLQWYIRHDGYPEVFLTCGNRREKKFVHHLVLEAFTGPCPPGMEALHGPGGKLDPTPGDLHWGTRSENVGADRLRDGQDNRGERSGHAKLTWPIVAEIRARVAAGERQTALADEFGVSKQTVCLLVHWKTWAYPPAA